MKTVQILTLMLIASTAVAQLQPGINRMKIIVSAEAYAPGKSESAQLRQGLGAGVAATWNPESGGMGFITRATVAHNWSTNYASKGLTAYGLEAGIEMWWHTTAVKDSANSAFFLNATAGAIHFVASPYQYTDGRSSTLALGYHVQAGFEYMQKHRIFLGVQFAQPQFERVQVRWIMIRGGFGVVL